ncbi:helix-turn-helix domain-containing protein [Albimonas sp. CAU 1670]|uniref:helix-turn-helix transcriptional regulator n=1 Tax=Albimonas sp. CAU 1670 TaxID=3032599 RepID=UPI0023DB0310|nr:helix-turn-helix domain-containing protein [Albimonas sp. CAU 1670]MDF2234962.1 helix-turn-helix domain-containing protein [Albimonas sp. CAU 1670]
MHPAEYGRRLLSRDEIQAEYGITRRWLELAAHRGDGPPMRKISRRMVRYDRAEFEAWLDASKVE